MSRFQGIPVSHRIVLWPDFTVREYAVDERLDLFVNGRGLQVAFPSNESNTTALLKSSFGDRF